MGIVIRQSVKTIAVTLTGAVLGVVINLLSIRYFDPKDYGFTQNLIKIAVLVCYFSYLGIGTTMVIYGQKYDKDHPLRRDFLSLCVLVPIVTSTLITLLFFALKPWIVSAYHSGDELMMDQFYILFPLLTFFTAVMAWMEGYLQSLYKTAIASLGREILSRLLYLGVIVVYVFGWINFGEFLYWYSFLYGLPILYFGYFMYKIGGFKLDLFKIRLPKAEVKKIIHFSWNQTLVILSVVLILQIDSVLVGPLSFQGLEALAVYSTAMFAISIMRNPIKALSIAALPSLSNSYQKIQLKELRRNFSKSATSIQLIIIFCVACLVLGMDDLQLMLNAWKPGYELVGPLILILVIGNGIDLFSGLSFEVIALSKYYRYNTYFALACLVVIVGLIYLLIVDYGLLGVAWASTIGLSLYAGIKSYFVFRKFKTSAFSKASILLLLIGAIGCGLLYYVHFVDIPVLNAMIKIILFSIYFGIVVIKTNVSKDINNMLQKFLPFKI